jgi:hypothetical protein
LSVRELQGLVDPLAGVAVRWGGDGGCDGPVELLGACLVMASIRTGTRVLAVLRAVLDGLPDDAGLGDFCERVDLLAVKFGQDGDPETAAVLLDYTADVASWQGRWQS